MGTGRHQFPQHHADMVPATEQINIPDFHRAWSLDALDNRQTLDEDIAGVSTAAGTVSVHHCFCPRLIDGLARVDAMQQSNLVILDVYPWIGSERRSMQPRRLFRTFMRAVVLYSLLAMVCSSCSAGHAARMTGNSTVDWNPFYPEMMVRWDDSPDDYRWQWHQLLNRVLALRSETAAFANLQATVAELGPDAEIAIVLEAYDTHADTYGYAALFRTKDRLLFRASPLPMFGTWFSAQYDGAVPADLQRLSRATGHSAFDDGLESTDYFREYLADERFAGIPVFLHIYNRRAEDSIGFIFDHFGRLPAGVLPLRADAKDGLTGVPEELPIKELIEFEKTHIYMRGGWVEDDWYSQASSEAGDEMSTDKNGVDGDGPFWEAGHTPVTEWHVDAYWAELTDADLRIVQAAFRDSYSARLVLNAMLLMVHEHEAGRVDPDDLLPRSLNGEHNDRDFGRSTRRFSLLDSNMMFITSCPQ